MKNYLEISADKFRKTHKYLLPIYPLMALLIAVGYFFAIKYDYDDNIGHFEYGSVFFIVFTVAIVICAALALLYSRTMTKTLVFATDPADSALGLFGSIFGGVMALLVAFLTIKDGLDLLTLLEKGAALLLIPLALFLFLGCASSMTRSKLRSAFAILGALSINLTIFSDYFDFFLPLNSPVRNLILLTQLSVMLFLLSEARLTFGVESHRPTVSFSYLTAVLAATIAPGYSLGGVLVYLFAPMADDPNPPLARLGLYIAIGIIALGRLVQMPALIIDKPEKTEDESTAEALAGETSDVSQGNDSAE